MTAGQDLFADMVRAKIRREDQSAEITRLRDERDELLAALTKALPMIESYESAQVSYRDHQLAEQARALIARIEARTAGEET